MTAGGGEVLLTGTTGFIGMELLARYLERGRRGVVALVRADGPDEARARIKAVLDNLFGRRAADYTGRVQAVAADVTVAGLGLTGAQREELAERVSTIVHCAASVSFTLPLAEARTINVVGTRRMLDFAELVQERGSLDCYGHVSTAYVAGDHAGRFCEGDLDVGQEFHNTYEQTKYEAEQLVRSRELPSKILRPSIVVGDRRSGWTAAFNVLYWPLRALSRGLFAAVPAYATSPVDVVSIDYVADAIHALMERAGGAGETYHLIAGRNASTIGEIIGRASRYFRRSAPAIVPPPEFAALPPASIAQDAVLDAGRVYFPYFCIDAVFEDEATRARLDPEGILASPLLDYLERLLDFATRSGWGKRPIARAEARAV